jgi:hypothetical protein
VFVCRRFCKCLSVAYEALWSPSCDSTEGGFAIDSTVRVITSQRINSLAAAPTAYRMLMGAGDGAMAPANHLRIACSCGEPLNPEVIRWADRVLHVPLCDQYGQIGLADELERNPFMLDVT